MAKQPPQTYKVFAKLQGEAEQASAEGNVSGATPAIADDVLPDTLVILPLPGRPFFPVRFSPLA